MQKKSDDALEKLRQAVELKEAFEIGIFCDTLSLVLGFCFHFFECYYSRKYSKIFYFLQSLLTEIFVDDVSLIDNVFSAQLVKSNDDQRLLLCEEWINLLAKIPPTANARWMTHYQFSIYYCFHMVGAIILLKKICYGLFFVEKTHEFLVTLPR